jgi:hypothetical protein
MPTHSASSTSLTFTAGYLERKRTTMSDLCEGARCTIVRDIHVPDGQAFTAGEVVTIEKVDPNRERPEYKYVVYSAWLDKRFLLSESDVTASVAEPKPEDVHSDLAQVYRVTPHTDYNYHRG